MINGCLQTKNNHYYAVLYLKVDGKRKTKWVPTGLEVSGNKRRAEAILNELRVKYDTQSSLEQSSKGEPFVTFMKQWLELVKSQIALKTYDSYKQLIDGRITSYFEPLQVTVDGLTPRMIEDFYQTIKADGCNANTVIHYHAVIRKALQSAVKKDMIPRNPADRVDKPKKNVYVGSHYSKDEMNQLFEAMQGDPMEIAVILAAYFGLRRSEVLGVRWSAINFEEKTITINHKVVESTVAGKTVLIAEDSLKTKSSYRTLPLIPAVEQKLLEEKKRQQQHQKWYRREYSKEYLDYVCVDSVGQLLRPNYITEHFDWFLEKHGFRHIRFHDLRHTCASLLLANKVPMKQIQLWLGHSTMSTTADIYAHLDYQAQEESAQIAAIMFETESA